MKKKYGQCGFGYRNTTGCECAQTLSQINPLNGLNVIQATTAEYHSLILLNNGTVYGIGDNQVHYYNLFFIT
jgi:alpha-tubulin suppressor-like RCC1 family protein